MPGTHSKRKLKPAEAEMSWLFPPVDCQSLKMLDSKISTMKLISFFHWTLHKTLYNFLLLLPVKWTFLKCSREKNCATVGDTFYLSVKSSNIWKHLLISHVFTLVVLIHCICTLIFPFRTAAPSSASLNTYRSILYSLPPRRLKPKPLLSRSRSTE